MAYFLNAVTVRPVRVRWSAFGSGGGVLDPKLYNNIYVNPRKSAAKANKKKITNMSDAIERPSPIRGPKRRSRFVDFFIRLVKEKPLGTFGGLIILILIVVAIFADVLTPYPYDKPNLVDRLQGSSARHLLGTDQFGRDLLSRLIVGARISLVVGLAATTLNVLVALLVGGTSGFLGGKVDLVVQRFVDAWMAFPALLILLTIMSIVGRGIPQIIVVLGIAGGISGSRVVRGAVIGVKENDYFLAARAVGTPTSQILLRHVLPNIAAVVIIIFSINIGGVIMSEASLSFLGFGLPAQIPSWGGLLSREGRQFMEIAPWLALWPGLALTIVVYSLNMFGDAVRDLLDPRLRGGQGSYGTEMVKRKRGFLARLINPFA